MRMNSFDSLIWRGGTDTGLRHTVTLLLSLDRIPAWDELLAAHERATRRIPLLSHRAVAAFPPVFPPTWRRDNRFVLDYHVRRVAAVRPATVREVLDLARDFAEVPLARSRPAWQALLIESPTGDRAWYALKIHHALADGGALRRWLSEGFLTDSPTGDSARREQISRADGENPLARNQISVLSRSVRAVTSLAPHVPAGCVALARSLVRPRSARPAPPVFSASSLRWHFLAHHVRLADLRESGKSAGGTVNDAFVAGFLRALARYRDTLGIAVDRVSLGMAVDQRAADPDWSRGGNEFRIVPFAVPLAHGGATEQIRLVHTATRQALRGSTSGAATVFTALASRLPRAAVRRVAGSGAATVDIQTTNVRGMSRPGYLAGAKVTGLHCFPPLTGCAAVLSLWSYGETCCIGANVDPAAVRDTELFADCLRRGYADVVSVMAGGPRQ